MGSWSLKQAIKATEDRAKEDRQEESVVPTQDRVIWYVTTTNAINLAHSIVKDRLSHGYRGYQDLVGTFDAADVGEYRKEINY